MTNILAILLAVTVPLVLAGYAAGNSRKSHPRVVVHSDGVVKNVEFVDTLVEANEGNTRFEGDTFQH